MSYIRRQRLRGPRYDWISITIFFTLMIVGWLMIYAVGHNTEHFSAFDMSSQAGKQFIWIAVSIGFFLFIQLIDVRFWISMSYIFYGIGIILLILVLFGGTTINGSTSWFSIGGFRFQPAEFAKFATALGLASFLSNYKTDLTITRDKLLAIGVFLFPVALILLQTDAGSALVFLSFFIVLYREGMESIWYILFFILVGIIIASLIYSYFFIIAILFGLTAIFFSFNLKSRAPWIAGSIVSALFAVYLIFEDLPFIGLGLGFIYLLVLSFKLVGERMQRIVMASWPVVGILSLFSFLAQYIFLNILQPHQQERINVWLQPELCDPRGSLYNLLQSKMAIGSGGLYGKGYLEGTMTKLNYVPEQSTDFIFCTVGEEFGFIGTVVITLLFLGLLWRLTYIAELMKTSFERQYTYGIAAIIFFHFFINIGMTIGLAPVIGIPLPLISYGGSSLLIFTMMFAVIMKFYSSRQRI